MIDRFDHIHIQPSDFDRSLAFYRDTLGWSVVSEWGERGSGRGAVLSGGAIKVVLAERSKYPDAGERAASCDPPRHPRRRQAIPGVACRETAWSCTPGVSERGTRWFVVSDPDGNHIAFEEVNRHRG